jgi:catechol 2,3-dioxygenase-like lactoylglutathione lyase family enzyme
MLSKAGFATLTPVRNMDRAVKFYTKTLGGKLQSRAEGEMKDMWASVKIGKEEFWLISPSYSEGKKPDLAFSTFLVKDIKREVTDLKKRGAKFEKAEKNEWTMKVDGPISYDRVGATAFFKDTEGNLLMLFQGNEEM